MRPITFLLGLLLLLSCRSNKEEAPSNPEWARVDEILSAIQAPVFPDTIFLITDFGAVADGSSDCLPAIREAIARCHEAGGGQVLIPAGEYRVNGPIHLRSNVNLHVAEGATVRFSTEPADYLPVVYTRWEGVELMNYSPLIYAFEQENIAVSGAGVLDGQAGNDNWWPWSGKDTYGWEEGMPQQADSMSRPRLFRMNELRTPVEERVFGEGTYLRPNFLQPYRCKNVLIEGVTIRNAPMWIIHPVLCENVTVRNVRVISHGPNSDGCDPESCRNVLIRNCYFDTGDDCIALKSGRNQDGREIGRPIENVVVQDCEMKDGHGGVVIGSEVSGGARNIFAENCRMDSPNLDRAIRVKTNKTRGGVIENLYFRNIEVGQVKEAVVRVNMRYPIYTDPKAEFVPEVRNIYVENVTSTRSEYGVLVNGYSEAHPVRGLHLTNCRFDGVEKGNSIEHAAEFQFDSLFLNGELVTAPAGAE